MDIAEIKERKFKLIQDMSKLLRTFETETGAEIEDIVFENAEASDDRKLTVTFGIRR